ncbi:ionotropic receptor 75a-like [Leptidea sinapis]|uniref:ionotropic receptor 75a-like n=1 Tax=Leptidea sinapis TaxID=189913 RepID=UPI0021C4B866|nr:ionotropic receptor 75a-like [Leptidea sinapis]
MTRPSIGGDTLHTQWYLPLGVLIDGSCGNVDFIFEEASKGGLFDASHIWLIIENAGSYGNVSGMSIESRLQRANLSVDADIVVAQYNDNEYILTDIFNFGKIQGNKLERKYLGVWRNGLHFPPFQFKYYDRWDFHNLTLRAVTVILGEDKIFSEEIITSSHYTNGVSKFTKEPANLLKILRSVHNFRFNYTVAGRWIGPTGRSSTPSVCSMLYWQEQDISYTSIRMVSNWSQGIDFIQTPASYLGTKFFYLIPNKGIGSYENRFLSPLSPGAWWCTLAAAIACSTVLAASVSLERKPFSGLYAMLSIISIMSQQVFDEGVTVANSNISSQSRQVTLAVAGLTSVLLYNYYTSSVVSWLLNAAAPTLSTIDELIDSDFELIFEDIGYTRGWLEDVGFYYYSGYKNTKEDELREKKVQNVKRITPMFQSVREGVELIRTGGYAYHTEPYNAYQYISRTFHDTENCRLGSLPMMPMVPTYVVVQKHSPYKEFFDWSLLRLKERGFTSVIKSRLAGVESRCSGSSPRALALGQAAPAFTVLLHGLLAAVLVLLLEILSHR